jgi:hypothetical protein
MKILKPLTVKALQRGPRRVERSETSGIFASRAAEIGHQRFFASLRMTPVLNASTIQPFNGDTNQ